LGKKCWWDWDDGGTSVAADILGNIYITGRFMSPAFIFDSDTLINTGWEDLFIAKCDTNGNIFWIKSATGSQDDWPTSVAVDNLGNAYLADGIQACT